MMASAGAQVYWCHQCNRTVRAAGEGEILCPDCHEGFVEEVESPAGDVPASLGADVYGRDVEEQGGFHAYQGTGRRPRGAAGGNPGLVQWLETISTIFQQIQTHGVGLNVEEEGGSNIRVGTETGPMNPTVVLQGQMLNFPGGRGNIEFFFDNGTGTASRRLPGNIGDYFLGPGLDQLIQQLVENDPNRYGAPPASKSAVEAMPIINITDEHLVTDAAHCPVCKDEFELGTEVRQMPCKHMYHPDCILPWLEQHNSCPVCRFEMVTDDPDYDQARAQAQASTGISGNPDAEGTQGGGEQATAGTGGFTILGNPGQFTMRFPGGDGRNDAAAHEGRSSPTSAGTSGTAQGGSTGDSSRGAAGRRFPFTLPWLWTSAASSQSPANDHTESSSQANGAEIVSSGPIGEANDIPGQNSRALRTDDDGDTLMSEPQQEDLD